MLAFLQREYSYFQHLGSNVQKFFLSCMISGFADPIMYAFLTAFLYRETHNFIPIAIYYSGFYIGLPIAFFANGILLRFIRCQVLYWIGTLIEGFIIIAITVVHLHTTPALFFWGIGFGIGAGFFWANRNFLTLRVVHEEKRMYYGSLESGVGTVINILAPLLTASVVVIFAKLLPNGISLSYQLLSVFAFCILFITGFIIQSMESIPDTQHFPLVTKSSKHWSILRLYMLSNGILSGIVIFFPTLMVFTFLGKEGTLGSIQSLVSAISAIIVLLFASRVTNKHALLLLGISILSATFGSLAFGILFSSIGVIFYLLSDAISMPFLWAPYNTISFNAIDTEQAIFGHPQFAYIFDQELFLNIGRLAGIGIFLFLAITFGTIPALRFSPLILSLLQISQLFFARYLMKKKPL